MSNTVLTNTLRKVRKPTETVAKRAPAGAPNKVCFNTVLDITFVKNLLKKKPDSGFGTFDPLV